MISRKNYKHKQSKYSTLMLVPSSSDKVMRIRIPHWLLYAALSASVIFVCTSVIFSLHNRELQKSVNTFSTNLEETIKINEELFQDNEKLSEEMEAERIRLAEQMAAEKERLNTQLEEEKARALEELQKEKEGYIDSLDFYESKLIEFELQMDVLEKAKQEIYNKLSRMELPSSITNRLIPIEDSLDTNISLLSISYINYNEDKFSEIDFKITNLNLQLHEKTLEFQVLAANAALVKPYLDALPSIWPVRGRVTSEVGSRLNPFTNSGMESHSGMDIAVPTGTSIKATGAGTVTFAGWEGGYGNIIRINHGYGITTVYGHNSRLLVKTGDVVEKGQEIAKSGNTGRSTGPHLHYEVRLNGAIQNPRNYFP